MERTGKTREVKCSVGPSFERRTGRLFSFSFAKGKNQKPRVSFPVSPSFPVNYDCHNSRSFMIWESGFRISFLESEEMRGWMSQLHIDREREEDEKDQRESIDPIIINPFPPSPPAETALYLSNNNRETPENDDGDEDDQSPETSITMQLLISCQKG